MVHSRRDSAPHEHDATSPRSLTQGRTRKERELADLKDVSHERHTGEKIGRPDRYEYVEHDKPWRYQEGEYTVTRGSAWSGPGCHLGCGLLMYTDKDGKLVKVEGDPDNPFNEGRLCVRCLDLMESAYNENRVVYPMKRKPEDRGKDAWERITWDEAYDLIAEKFLAYKEEFGAQSVLFFKGTGRDIAPWISHLAWSFGSPNVVFALSGCACFVPRIASSMCTSGSFWVGDYSQQFTKRYDDPRCAKRPHRCSAELLGFRSLPLRALYGRSGYDGVSQKTWAIPKRKVSDHVGIPYGARQKRNAPGYDPRARWRKRAKAFTGRLLHQAPTAARARTRSAAVADGVRSDRAGAQRLFRDIGCGRRAIADHDGSPSTWLHSQSRNLRIAARGLIQY